VNKLWRLLALGLCLLATHFPAVVAATQTGDAQSGTVKTDNSERQLLVMLHLPPPHFRPDSNYSGRYADDAGHRARRRIAEEIAHSYNLQLISDWPMPTLGVDCYVMEAASPESSARAEEILSHDPRVEWVQPMRTYHSLENRDPLYPLQPSAKYWHLSEIHQATTGRNIRVAIVDSGVDDNHPDLTGQVKLKENFIDGNPYVAESHGTAVAGIIAAIGGNGVGIVGVAPQARLMALRACWEVSERETQCNSFTLGKAINFAIMNKAQVINLSLTGPPDRLLQRLFDAALAQGITIVGAADPLQADGGFPASYPGVLAIADMDAKHAPAGVMMAPGKDIPTTEPGGKWRLVSGASFACAHVTGMIALLLELRPALVPAQVRRELSFDPAASLDGRPAAVIDACATIAKSAGFCLRACTAAHASKAIH
jgi:hypothetical protein